MTLQFIFSSLVIFIAELFKVLVELLNYFDNLDNLFNFANFQWILSDCFKLWSVQEVAVAEKFIIIIDDKK